MSVNGLYGHVRRNDVRSLALFAGFVLAFHALAVLALLLPLAMFDPDHAPIYGWTGYLVRWVPIITIVGAVLFVVQMLWHVRVVRRRTDFHFVDAGDEARLCRIVEPLTIAAGLPTPYVGVIESPALNAFACGIRKKDAVLVFTRGLIDELDDDELAAVAAHEIMHIVNGDIRLIAATNVCLDTLWIFQHRRHSKRVNRVWEAMMLPMLALAMPLLVVLVLVISYLRQLAVDGSHLTRKLIASAREFIADAEAVRLTHNPAALVSALRRIDGRSAIPGLAAGQDAMMIDGAHQGAMATHPTIAERIAAIAAVTGSMTFIAPARRDTRPPGWRLSRPAPVSPGGGFGRRVGPIAEADLDAGQGVLARLFPAEGFNRLGLTREMTVGAAAAIGVFVWSHGSDLGNPAAMAAALDPAPLRTVFAMGGKGFSCQMQGFSGLLGMTEMPTDCGDAAINEMLAQHKGAGGILGKMAEAAGGAEGLYSSGNGTFGNVAPADVKLAAVKAKRCFHTDGYSVGDRGLHSVSEEPSERDNISLPRWLAAGDRRAREAVEAAPGERDAALLAYFSIRKAHGEAVHRFFGEPGLDVARARYAAGPHQGALAALRQRVADPGFAAELSPVERAELELLAAQPQEFVTCTARRKQPAET
jgi:Zn-dependent protease with chaperone function